MAHTITCAWVHIRQCATKGGTHAPQACTKRDKCSAADATEAGPDKPQRERELLDAALSALRSDGNVLVPCDAAGRVLELLLIFEHHWCAMLRPLPLQN